MQAVKARVKNGRLLVDEPTTLPEGAELQLAIIDGDDLDDAERAGNLEDLSKIISELRPRL
jgi:hypothetical protein